MISEIKHWISITFAIQKFLHFTKITHHLPNLLNLNFNDSSNILKLLQKKKRKNKINAPRRKIEPLVPFGVQNHRLCNSKLARNCPTQARNCPSFPKTTRYRRRRMYAAENTPAVTYERPQGRRRRGDRGWRSENGEEPRILLNIQPDTLADWLLIIRPTRITINLAVSRVCSPQTLHLPPPSPSILLQSGADRSWINEKGERALCTRRKSNASRS